MLENHSNIDGCTSFFVDEYMIFFQVKIDRIVENSLNIFILLQESTASTLMQATHSGCARMTFVV